jgi:cobalt-zinc-cadmium efflux system outer membrane protein
MTIEHGKSALASAITDRVRHLCRVPLLIVLGVGAVQASENPTAELLTVSAAVTKAVRDNPSLAEMQSRYEALSEVPSQVASLPDPMINFGAMNFPTDTFDRAQEPMTQLQLGISQAFPFPGKLALKQEVAEHDARAAGHSVDEARLQLVRRVKSNWWQLYYIDRALETLDRNQELLGQFIGVARTKYETGKGLQQDVLLAQLELSKLIDQKIQLDAIRRQRAIQLNILMDLSPELEIGLPSKVGRALPELASEADLYLKAEEARPLLRKLETKVDAARSRLDLAKRDYYPDLMVGLTYGDRTGVNPMPRGGARSDFLSVMLGVKIPIYAKRKQSKAVAQRGFEVQSSRYALLDERGLVRGAIATSMTDYHRAKKQLSLFEAGIVPQAEQTVNSMLAGYQVSEVDFLNLVRSQMTLFNYELRYWKALSEAKQALAQLEAAVGEETVYE